MCLDQIGLTPLRLGLVDQLGETDILLDALLQLTGATVTIGGFKAGHATQTGLQETFTQRRQGTRDIVGRGVMVNHRGTTALDGLQRADQAAVVERLLIQCPIQAPPQIFQGGDEVRAGGDVRHDAARQTGVKMVVRADDAWHDQAPVHLFHLRIRELGMQVVADGADLRAVDGDIDAFPHLRRLELHGGDILQNQHDYSSTRPSR